MPCSHKKQLAILCNDAARQEYLSATIAGGSVAGKGSALIVAHALRHGAGRGLSKKAAAEKIAHAMLKPSGSPV